MWWLVYAKTVLIVYSILIYGPLLKHLAMSTDATPDMQGPCAGLALAYIQLLGTFCYLPTSKWYTSITTAQPIISSNSVN